MKHAPEQLKGEGREILIFKAQLKAFNDVLSYGTKEGGLKDLIS